MESIRSRLQSQQHGWGDHPNVSSPPAIRDAVVEDGFTWCSSPHKDEGGLSSKEHMNTTAPAQAHPVKVSISTKDWTLHKLIGSGKRFHAVPRVSALAGEAAIKDAIRRYEDDGEPMIISDWHKHESWPTDMFSPEWLLQNGDQRVTARNCLNWTDKEMSLSEFIEKSRNSAPYAESTDTERFYGKDATCPPQWEQWIDDGPLPKDLLMKGPHNIMKYLPESEKIEHLMCYLGIGDTFTPAHKDLCGSSGHNLMCYTENNGSSFWFMTESSSASAAALYFQSLNHELDHEQKVITPEELAKAPFKVYITEQNLGDLVLVPKRSCHQVVNNGGLTIKASWSRMTIDGLVAAFYYELPIYRRVCRKETYRVKTLCYHALSALGDELGRLKADSPKSLDNRAQDTSVEQTPVIQRPSAPEGIHPDQHSRLGGDVQKLLEVFGKIIKEENSGACMVFTHGGKAAAADPSVESGSKLPLHISEATEMTYIACDFCGADIFQSFFECTACATPEAPQSTDHESVQAANFAGDPIIICPGCYIEGRSCLCTQMVPRQCRLTEDLFHLHNGVADMLNSLLKSRVVVTTSPKWFKAVPMSWRYLKSPSIRHPRLFEAACLLWETRQCEVNIKKMERSCLPRFAGSRGGPHVVPRISALNCKKCHSAKCFTHIIELGIHASEALIKHLKDPVHEEWHAFHIMERGKVDNKHLEVKNGEVDGKPVDANYILMVAAQRFTYCHPLSPRTVIGWYDDGYHNAESFLPYALDPDIPSGSPTVQSGTPADHPPPITIGQEQMTSAPLVFAPGVESPPRRRTANAVLIHSQTMPRKVVSVTDASETQGNVHRQKRRKLELVVELYTMAALGKSTADYHPMAYYFRERQDQQKRKPVSTARAKRVVTSDIESEDSGGEEEYFSSKQKSIRSVKLLVNKPSANKPPLLSGHQPRPLVESRAHFVGGPKGLDKVNVPAPRDKDPWGPKRLNPKNNLDYKSTSTAGPSRQSGSSVKLPITPKPASKQVRNPATPTTSLSSPIRDSTSQPLLKKPRLALHFKKKSHLEVGDSAVSSDQCSSTRTSKYAALQNSQAGPSSSQSPTQPPPYGSTSSDQLTEVLTLLKSLRPEGGNRRSTSPAPSDRATEMLATILPVIKALLPDRRLEDKLTIEGQAREIQSLKDQLKAKDDMMETLRKDIAQREESLMKTTQSTQNLQSTMNSVLRNTPQQPPVILQVHSHGVSPPFPYSDSTQQMNHTDYNYNQTSPHAWRSRPRGYNNYNGYPGRNDRQDHVNNWERKFTSPQQRPTRFGFDQNNSNYGPRQQKRRFGDGPGENAEWVGQNRHQGRQTPRWPPYERYNNEYGSHPYHAHQSTDDAWNATDSSPSKAAESSSSANVGDAKRSTSRELVAVPRAPLPLPVHGRRVDAEDEDINVDTEYLVREEDERDPEGSPLMSRPDGSSARIQEVDDDMDGQQQPDGQYQPSEPARPPSVPPSEIEVDDHRSPSVHRQLGFVPSDQFGAGVWESTLIKKKI